MGIDRASANDLMELAADRGSVPMHFGAVLEFEPATAPDVQQLAAALAARVGAVPRLRCVLRSTPPGCGRPVWVADSHFSLSRHLDVAPLDESPGDPLAAEAGGEAERRDGLHAAVMRLLLARLPDDRPAWRARALVDGDGRAHALVLVLHHVLGDGMGGLAVLGALADGSRAVGAPPEVISPAPATRLPTPLSMPVSPPLSPDASALALARDAWVGRLRALRALPVAWRSMRAGAGELGLGRPTLAGRTTLLAPTSSERRLDVVEVGLDPVHAAARRCGATVNDLVLVAVAGCLGRLLARRDERLEEVVVSVPVSARASATASQIGNQVGVMPVRVPVSGDLATRLAAVAAQTRRLGTVPSRGRSAGVLSPVFRLLASTGVLQWFIARQRLVHTFETNLRGPVDPVSLAGGVVARIVPVAVNPGNVTVSFGVLSYAGRLVVSVVTDPRHVPEHGQLASWLRLELVGVCADALGTHGG